jgi:hypothetical protein
MGNDLHLRSNGAKCPRSVTRAGVRQGGHAPAEHAGSAGTPSEVGGNIITV